MTTETTAVDRGAATPPPPSGRATAAEPLQLERRRTYDLVTRLLHGVIHGLRPFRTQRARGGIDPEQLPIQAEGEATSR